MEHVKAILIKFVMIAVVLGIVLTGIYDGEFGDTLLISLVLTIVAYILGDLLLFRRTGDNHGPSSDYVKRNTIATVSDAVLAFLVVWLMGKALFINDGDVLSAAFLSALIIAAGEWFFHKYLDDHVFREKHSHYEA
ncbi:YndM family protein [Domibacillus sp. 8LH]|uniref:YndM family protein n=1 Tax=unclassified Domibacillus TaxID=2632383 RepID=UPI0028EC094D|nr:YndM family protein [Domibacillus sp. DTU_2020_1001157_1_SI_ALB_TIR_016]WNS78296.1 YndM family protein [Domibacillus sp. DTU_2020_1001157_1_SI_ALB_TIR_016]